MSSKSTNAKAQGAPATPHNGTEPTYPIIGIDPGNPLAVAILARGRPPSWYLLSKGALPHSVLDPYLPAYVFIEIPVGGDPYIQDKVDWIVKDIIKELSPFDRERQLIPCSVWRKEILGNGNATKDDAIKWARKQYPKVYGALPFDSDDLAEAFCIAEYGRRVITGHLRHGPPGIILPRYELAPPKRRSSHPPKYEMDRDSGSWPETPPIPWRLLRQHGGDTLAGIVRTWASCYEAVTAHCAARASLFSARAIAADARVRPQDIDKHLEALLDADLTYMDGGCIVFRPVTEATIWKSGSEKRFHNLFATLFAPHIQDGGKEGAEANWNTRKLWAKGTGDPALRASNWKREAWRKRHDARWGHTPCEGCGTHKLAQDELLCGLCQEGALTPA